MNIVEKFYCYVEGYILLTEELYTDGITIHSFCPNVSHEIMEEVVHTKIINEIL